MSNADKQESVNNGDRDVFVFAGIVFTVFMVLVGIYFYAVI